MSISVILLCVPDAILCCGTQEPGILCRFITLQRMFHIYMRKYSVCMLAQIEPDKVRIEMQDTNLTKVC